MRSTRLLRLESLESRLTPSTTTPTPIDGSSTATGPAVVSTATPGTPDPSTTGGVYTYGQSASLVPPNPDGTTSLQAILANTSTPVPTSPTLSNTSTQLASGGQVYTAGDGLINLSPAPAATGANVAASITTPIGTPVTPYQQ